MKKSLFFSLCLLLTSLTFAQIEPNPDPKEDCSVPCLDLRIHIYTDVEILNEFNGATTTLNEFVMNNFNTADGLLDNALSG